MIVRKPGFTFPTNMPPHWLGGSVFKTHLCNSFTLMFPTGEKFFIRSVQKFLPILKDEKLKEEVKIFMRQEAQHALEHEKFFQFLRDSGHDVDQIHLIVEKVITKFVETAASSKTCLSLTAGFEHLTALLSEIALTDDFFKDAHPDLRKLFEWHAIEEFEHRSVAFDVLNETDPSYIHRAAGLLAAYVIFSVLTALITGKLLFNDRALFKKSTLKEAMDVFFFDHALLPKATVIFARYLLPGFHPSKYTVDEVDEIIGLRGALYGTA